MRVQMVKKCMATSHYIKQHLATFEAEISNASTAVDERVTFTGTIYLVCPMMPRAAQVFDALPNPPGVGSEINLRWWDESPCASNHKSSLPGRWVGYSYSGNFFEVAQNERLCGPSVVILYYCNGKDPVSLLDHVFQDAVALDFNTNILPVAEYVFDRKSCKNVWTSVFATLLWVKAGRELYFAPLPWQQLGSVRLEHLLRHGGDSRRLGHINRHHQYYNVLRSEREQYEREYREKARRERGENAVQ